MRRSLKTFLAVIILLAVGAAGFIGWFHIRAERHFSQGHRASPSDRLAVVEGVHHRAVPAKGVASPSAPRLVPPPPAAREETAPKYLLPEGEVDADKAEQVKALVDAAVVQMNSDEQLNAPVPEPRSFELALKIRTSVARFYNREGLNPRWAAAMEANLLQLFTADRLAPFPGLKVEAECRISTCRLTLDAPEQLVDEHAPAYLPWDRSIAVMDQVLKQVWPVAPGQKEILESDTRFSLVLLFDKDSIDPEKYPAWQQVVHEKWHAAYLAQIGNDKRGPLINPKVYRKL